MTKWTPAHNAPKDALAILALVMITCECGKGGITVCAAGRQDGEWILADMEHDCEVLGYVQYDMPKEGDLGRMLKLAGLDWKGNRVGSLN